jgi:hypothetical protein
MLRARRRVCDRHQALLRSARKTHAEIRRTSLCFCRTAEVVAACGLFDKRYNRFDGYHAALVGARINHM